MSDLIGGNGLIATNVATKLAEKAVANATALYSSTAILSPIGGSSSSTAKAQKSIENFENQEPTTVTEYLPGEISSPEGTYFKESNTRRNLIVEKLFPYSSTTTIVGEENAATPIVENAESPPTKDDVALITAAASTKDNAGGNEATKDEATKDDAAVTKTDEALSSEEGGNTMNSIKGETPALQKDTRIGKHLEAEVHDTWSPFVPPEYLNITQIIFLGFVYAYLLCQGSELISNGSELLLLVPSLADVVGSVVLPVLGAVPDGMMVLVSGLGKNAQNEIFVGLGTMAGSTVMLLTVVWWVSVLGGAVDYDASSGRLNYKKPKEWNTEEQGDWEKLSPNSTIFNSAIQVKSTIRDNIKYMLGTLMPLIIVQIGAYCRYSIVGDNPNEVSKEVRNYGEDIQQRFVLVSLVLSIAGYIWYLQGQYENADESDVVSALQLDAIQQALKSEMLTLEGALGEVAKLEKYYKVDVGNHNLVQPLLPGAKGVSEGQKDNTKSDMKSHEALYGKLQQVLRPYFKKYDTNGDGVVDFEEFRVICAEVSHSATKEAQLAIFQRMDVDRNGSLCFDEFVECMLTLTRKAQEYDLALGNDHLFGSSDKSDSGNKSGSSSSSNKSDDGVDSKSDGSDESGDDDEQEDVPEDLAHLSPEEQQRRIKVKAAWQCALGTAMIVLFSDPMVDVLDNLAKRISIPSFFVSFVLSPLVSNASELIAAWNYAKKKTVKSATISLATCEGAACMNNTFCLFCFLFCIWWERLTWDYTMETSCVVLVEVIMCFFALKSIHTVFSGYIVLSLYVFALIFVWVGTHIFGFS